MRGALGDVGDQSQVLDPTAYSAQPGTAPATTAPIDSGADYFPGAQWRVAQASATGFDPVEFGAFARRVQDRSYGRVDGLVVVRFGHLVLEQYGNGWTATRAHTIQSVTKSVTSLLFGILQAQHPGAPTALDRPVLDVFARYTDIASVDDRKRALTLRHLLTMRTNMDYWEQPQAGSPHEQLNQSSGAWVKFVLDRPMTGAPGSSWSYNSGAAIVMGGVVREISGRNVDVFARDELFAPIGVTGESWARSPFDALPHTGGGLSLRTTDLARVGYLVLRHGKWGGRQVVPPAWIDSSTRVVTRGSPVFFSDYNAGYGHFWWLFPRSRGGTDSGIIAGYGSEGQWLFVVPSLDLVVAVTAKGGDGLELIYALLGTLR